MDADYRRIPCAGKHLSHSETARIAPACPHTYPSRRIYTCVTEGGTEAVSHEKAHGRTAAKATSFDIAYRAGVSQPTVSRALRGSPQVSEATRQRVLAVARQLNYQVDKNASNLRRQRSSTLALLIFEDPTPDDSAINPFFLSGLSIGSDNCQGGHQAARHLLGLGRRRLAFLGGASSGCPEFLDRYRGFLQALDEAGVSATPALQVDAITTEEAGYVAARELLGRGVRFDAIVGASDLIALGALRALNEHRIEVPGAVSVVGFDDIPAAALANPPLTTIAQNTRLAGEVLVDTLVRRIRNTPAEAQMLPTRLVVRGSCGAGAFGADRS